MSKPEFSIEAKLVWAGVTPDNQKKVLQKVWCGQCRTSVEMISFKGRMEQGDLILNGKCKNCGKQVCRVLETSEVTHKN